MVVEVHMGSSSSSSRHSQTWVVVAEVAVATAGIARA
jgi:hypothetical protein